MLPRENSKFKSSEMAKNASKTVNSDGNFLYITATLINELQRNPLSITEIKMKLKLLNQTQFHDVRVSPAHRTMKQQFEFLLFLYDCLD